MKTVKSEEYRNIQYDADLLRGTKNIGYGGMNHDYRYWRNWIYWQLYSSHIK